MKPDRRIGVKKPHHNITRRILIGATEQERRPLLEDVKYMIRQGIDNALHTAQSLRKDYGILLPILSPEWDWVPTRDATPSNTITAFEGNRAEVRVTLHIDDLIDNTTALELEGHGISHLIGISISENQIPQWKRSDNGGMIAVIASPITALPSLLHDVLLDMAMIHAKAQPWTGLRNHLNSELVAIIKTQFVRNNNLIGRFAYGAGGESQYFPLAAFVRANGSIDLTSYIAIWSNFALFAKQTANLSIDCGREHLAERIGRSHVNGGQIPIEKLNRNIKQLSPGHYCLYFLIRRANTPKKIAALSAFFHAPKSHFRTQRWIIYPRDKVAKPMTVLLQEQYISVFPFYVGEEG